MSVFQALYDSYTKILTVNLTDDSYKILKMNMNERSVQMGFAEVFSQWINDFADFGNVYSEDVFEYKSKLKLNYLKEYFKNNTSTLSIRYRRRSGESFVWVEMELVKSPMYSSKKEEIVLFVKNINEQLTYQMEQQKELEKICSLDGLTQMKNFYSFKKYCMEYVQLNKRKNMGVIFADLNGLKIINDMKGHEAGNDFILDFCKLLEKLELAKNTYRLGGDEFIIILEDVESSELLYQGARLSEAISKYPVAPASVGTAFRKNTAVVEKLVKLAEQNMYKDKLKFYAANPEFKREAIEQSYSKEMNAIVSNLAQMYSFLGVINVQHGTYRLLKSDNNLCNCAPTDSYEAFMDHFVKEHVKAASLHYIAPFTTIDRLKLVLKNRFVTGNFQANDGCWYQITYNVIESEANKISKIIFYSAPMNSFMTETVEHEREIEEENEILEGIFNDYTMIALVDIPDQAAKLYKTKTLPDSVDEYIESHTYSESVSWFCDAFVYEDDKKTFLANTKLDFVQKELNEMPVFSFSIRTIPDFHETNELNYSRFYFYKLANNPDRLVFATKNITDETKQLVGGK